MYGTFIFPPPTCSDQVQINLPYIIVLVNMHIVTMITLIITMTMIIIYIIVMIIIRKRRRQIKGSQLASQPGSAG